jgi:hypothetical protein
MRFPSAIPADDVTAHLANLKEGIALLGACPWELVTEEQRVAAAQHAGEMAVQVSDWIQEMKKVLEDLSRN